jgi:hypothetical protein
VISRNKRKKKPPEPSLVKRVEGARRVRPFERASASCGRRISARSHPYQLTRVMQEGVIQGAQSFDSYTFDANGNVLQRSAQRYC